MRSASLSQLVSERPLGHEVHTSPEDRPSVPAWFAEVVIIAQHLATKGLLDALLESPLFWPWVNEGGTDKQKAFSMRCHVPLICFLPGIS